MNPAEMIQRAAEVCLTNVPRLIYRGRIFDYLYTHKVGDRLPRGKSFQYFRGMEKCATWDKEVHDFNFKIHNKMYASRLSPLLLSQVTFLSYLAIHYKAPLDAESVFDVIELLEGESTNRSTALLKHKIPFEENGPYSGYEHSHVAVLPNSYLEMLKKSSNQKRIVRHTAICPSLSVNFKKIENEIMSKTSHKEGRMTGFWLISRFIDNNNFYMGLFPHSRGAAKTITSKMHPDDKKICIQLQVSERLLKLKYKKRK